MRNDEFLDKTRPEDSKIGEVFYEDGKPCRIIDGETKENEDLQKCINRVRASGMSPSEYLKSLYR